MSLQDKSIAIIGGGIAGLAAATAVARFGARVVVLEQAESIAEVGAGLQVSPNGLRVLESLGLAAGLAAQGAVRARAVSLRDYRHGKEVVRLDLGRLGEGQEYHFVHRADLIGLLLEAARNSGAEIRLCRRATRVVTDGPGARIEFEAGAPCSADLVIAADGVRSIARGALNETAPARFTGQVAWRAVVPNICDHPPQARVHMGPGRHLVSYPLRGNRLVNLVAVEERADWTAEGWDHEDDAAHLRAAFDGFGGDVAQLLAQVASPGLWGLFWHPVATRWHGDGLVLTGDAAHPTLPFLAQGANMALEDAWVLADCLSRAPFGPALECYQALRQPRVRRVIEAAEGNAWKYHLRNPLVRGAAHLALNVAGRLAPGRMMHQFDWLYGHDVTRQA